MQLNFPSETYCVKNETEKWFRLQIMFRFCLATKKKHKKKLKDQNRLSCSSSE